MDWKFWTGYIAVVLVVGLVVFLRRSGIERALDKAAVAAGLGVPPEIRPLLLRRTRAVQIATLLGAVAGMALGAVLFSSHVDGPVKLFALQGSIALGGGAGIVVGGLTAARGLPSAGRRVARSRAVRVADYVSPVERRGALAGMLVALAVGVPCIAFGSTQARAALTITTAIALAGWAAFELASRRIVGRQQAADSALQLAWDDALRAAAIRRLAGSAGTIAIFALLASIWFETSALLPRADAEGIVASITVGVVVVLVTARLGLASTEPSRFFLRRLWPDTVAYAPERIAS